MSPMPQAGDGGIAPPTVTEAQRAETVGAIGPSRVREIASDVRWDREPDLEVEFLGEARGKGRHRGTPLMRGGKPVIGKGGRPIVIEYTDKKTREHEGYIRHQAAQAMKQAGILPLNEPLAIEIHVGVSIPQSWSKRRHALAEQGEILPTGRPDVDNVVKSVKDGCNKVVWTDDSRVCDLHASKRYDVCSRTLLRVWRIGKLNAV